MFCIALAAFLATTTAAIPVDRPRSNDLRSNDLRRRDDRVEDPDARERGESGESGAASSASPCAAEACSAGATFIVVGKERAAKTCTVVGKRTQRDKNLHNRRDFHQSPTLHGSCTRIADEQQGPAQARGSMAQKVHAEVEGATESESDAGAEAEGADDGAMLEFETEEELHERLQEEAHLGGKDTCPCCSLPSNNPLSQQQR